MTRGRTFTAAEIVRHGYVLAGLKNVKQAIGSDDASYGLDRLDAILARLAIEGMFPRDIVTYDLSLVTDQQQYSMPVWAFDVVDTGMWRPAGSSYPSSTETPVRPVSRQTWTERTGKDASGTPREYFCDRTTDTPTVWLWPIPGTAENASTIRFQCHQLKTTVTGAAGADVEGYWADYLAYAVAEDLAIGSGLAAQVALLAPMAAQRKNLCKMYAQEHVPQQMIIDHRGGWRNR